MDLGKCIENNPIVSMNSAFNLIACATLLKHGTSYLEGVDAAVKRLRTHAINLMEQNRNIYREYRQWDHDPDFGEYTEKVSGFEDCDLTASTVNFAHLLGVYNADLEAHGLAPILASHSSNNSQTYSSATPSEGVVPLFEAFGNMIKSIFDRNGLLTNDMLNSIIEEGCREVTDSAMYNLLPEIKASVKALAKDKVTHNRPKKIESKKIEAAIDIATHFKGDKIPLRNDVLGRIKRMYPKMPQLDRDQVADIYFEFRRP